MSTETLVWFGLMIVFLVIELITVGLTSIWLSAGSLAALFVSLSGVGILWQVLAFAAVSLIFLAFTRPFAMKYINARHEKTNSDGLVGKVVKITERVDNLSQTGTALANGLEWSARSEDDGVCLEKGSFAKVTGISGVKLILKKYEEEMK